MKDGPDGRTIRLQPSQRLDSLILNAAVGEASGLDTSASQRAIVYVLEHVFDVTDGATSTEIIEATGLAKSTFYHARAELLKAGIVESNGPRNRARYVLAKSNAVQRVEVPNHAQSPTSPTAVQGPGPVQSSPTTLKGLDVGLGDETAEKEAS